ncbi:MAG: hypothetical protein V1649_01130 [Patescibacteria group bacterium]
MTNKTKIKINKSSLSEFVNKQIASDDEVEAFDQYIDNEVRDKEIEESLEKIYQNDKGQTIDVKKMEIKKKNNWLIRLFNCLLLTTIFIACLAYAGYYLWTLYGPGLSSVNLTVDGNKEAMVGEEFFYVVNFSNNERIGMKNVEIKLTYPENFVFLDSQPMASQGNNTWRFSEVANHRSEIIKIKGKLVGETGSSNIIIADARYTPANFSSEFKKSASLETAINELGLEITDSSVSSVFVNEENEINLKFKAKEINYLSDFLIIADCPDNWEIIKDENSVSPLDKNTTPLSPLIRGVEKNAWQVSNLKTNELGLKIKFRVKEKKDDSQTMTLKFAQKSDNKNYVFYSKTLSYEILQSGLNLNMIINGSPVDQGADLGQTMNYTISYANKSNADLKDIIIMVVLKGDLLDLNSIKDSNGQVQNNTIIWTKVEIPALENLAKDGEGTINFSVKIKSQDQAIGAINSQIKSYAQFSTGGREVKEGETNRSNMIINKINSDLNLTEQVRYFSDDNLTMGSGPLPPKVGTTTSLKVYWTVNNNLHELNDLFVNVKLPDYVKWGNKNRASVGSLDYNEQNNTVSWNIGRLPTSVNKIDAEFNIEITPTEDDRNKILILLPGTAINAIDSETNAVIKKTSDSQTTKLKDDSMADTDGIVE